MTVNMQFDECENDALPDIAHSQHTQLCSQLSHSKMSVAVDRGRSPARA
jgi:hypothetical protein